MEFLDDWMPRKRQSETSRQCCVCSNLFSLTVHQASWGKKTCSPECLSKLLASNRKGKKAPGVGGPKRKSPDSFTCVICSQEFKLTTQAASDKKQTCSEECKQALYSKSKGGLGVATCETCKTDYQTSRYYLKKGRRFCSEKCRKPWLLEYNSSLTGENNPFWNGGRIEYYGSSWMSARRAAWKRDRETCQNCGKTKPEMGERPSVHHKIPFKSFGLDRHIEANALENLICLCRTCHLEVHWNELGR